MGRKPKGKNVGMAEELRELRSVRKIPITCAVLGIAIFAGASVRAQTTSDASQPNGNRRFHADAEVDPTAYILKGDSVHVGLGWQQWRLDLGVYSMALPEFVHGNKDFDVSFDGYGIKLQYFLFREQAGIFVGVDTGITRPLLQRKGTDLASHRTEYGVGMHAGWRFTFGEHVYLTPWIGYGYTINPHDVTLGGSTYNGSHASPFAAIHFGCRFL